MFYRLCQERHYVNTIYDDYHYYIVQVQAADVLKKGGTRALNKGIGYHNPKRKTHINWNYILVEQMIAKEENGKGKLT